jgi:multisubunit Na+/H+ antiporter MnhG subunit
MALIVEPEKGQFVDNFVIKVWHASTKANGGATTLIIVAFSIMTLSLKAFSLMTLSIVAFSMTLS